MIEQPCQSTFPNNQPVAGEPVPRSSSRYLCQRCANCCRWPGEVVLTEEDTLRIAAFLGLSPEAFVNRHTDLRRNRQGLTLRSREDGSCEFLDGKDCTLQPVKPEQCLGFPNQWRFPGWREMCEAIEVPP